ncbi:hypothetical protein HYU19_03950, partial [Candidatus Woesearchaeota archaeon]|nr:hypothetical protein [Candidatus Woesearchaeota archaeon]
QKYIVKNISYEGLLDYKHFFRVMDFWFRDKFYDKFEKLNEEFVGPEGKFMDFEFTPWKKLSDYHKCTLKVEGKISSLKPVIVNIGGKDVKMHHGKVNMKLTGYLIVDYWKRHNQPLPYFLRDLFDRYIYRHVTKKYYGMVVQHVTDLASVLEAYLNMAPKKL